MYRDLREHFSRERVKARVACNLIWI